MRFEDAYEGWTSMRLTQIDAARLLGGCHRTVRHTINRYEDDGLDGLIDKRLAQVSHRRAPVDEVGSHYWHTPEAGGKVDLGIVPVKHNM